MENIIAENKTQNIGFTQVPNNILNDTTISWGAKGLWAYMAGKPENWKFTIRLMARQSKDSVDATTSRLNELIKAGYVVRQEIMTKNGKQCFYSIYSEPNLEKPNLEKPNLEKPNLEKPNLEKPILEYSNKDISNKEISKNTTNVVLDKSEEVLEGQVVQQDTKNRKVNEKGEVVGGNVLVERAYELWEEIIGYPCKRDRWSSNAGWNMMRAKNKGEGWLRKMLELVRECKKDTKADFRASHISNLADLQKNQDYLKGWYLKQIEENNTSADVGLDFLRKNSYN